MYHVGALDGNGKVRLGMKGMRALYGNSSVCQDSEKLE